MPGLSAERGCEEGGFPFRSELEYSGMPGRFLDENQGVFIKTKNFVPMYELTFDIDTLQSPLAAS